jgi:hypothetical protein
MVVSTWQGMTGAGLLHDPHPHRAGCTARLFPVHTARHLSPRDDGVTDLAEGTNSGTAGDSRLAHGDTVHVA